MSETAPARSDVEAALARILEWPGLARSPQLARFLSYIVEARLSGEEANIKAYSIAVDVFGRPQSFDPQSDPIVRVQARRLRALLDDYYAEAGASEGVRFVLPVGRYVPEFRFAGPEAAPLEPEAPPQARPQRRAHRGSWSERLRDGLLVLLFGVVAVGIMLVLFEVLQPKPARMEVPQVPAVAVAEFTSVAAGNAPAASIAGLAVELVTDLQLFPYLSASYRQRAGDGETRPAAPFELSGVARSEGDEVQVTASLKRTGTDTVLWSRTVKVPADSLPEGLDGLSRAFADHLGAIGGPLHADALQWLAAHPDISGNETDYLCAMLFSSYRITALPADGRRARDCAAALIAREPDSPAALAMSGSLQFDETLRTQPPDANDPEPLREAERLLQRALALEPTASPVWREYALFLEAVGRYGEAEAAFTSSLQLNPANLDSLAGYGRLLSRRGESARGAAMAQDALERALAPPHWYHEAPAINALRRGDHAQALIHAEALAPGDAELGSVIAVAASHELGAEDALNRSMAQLLEVTRFRRFGILPVLRQRLPDSALVDEIAATLIEAGIDPAALEGPY